MMKITLKPLLIAGLAITTIELVSWTFKEPGANHNEKNFYASPPAGNGIPAAEDVLVQKIQGDKNHLLVMALYSKERFKQTRVAFNFNGATVIFHDDGIGEDKIAGDHLFTCKVTTDVNEFRRSAIMRGLVNMREKKGYRFKNREMTEDPDDIIGFDVKKFDKGEPVSIANITMTPESDDDDAFTDFSEQPLLAKGGPSLDMSDANAFDGLTGQKSTQSILNNLRAKSIFITDLSVVEDSVRTWNPCAQKGNVEGAWTFKTLMRQLASPDPQHLVSDSALSIFVKNWLSFWASTQVIAGDTAFARSAVNTKILNPWLNKSQNAGAPAGQLDMKFAPFKLTAIVNRFDIRTRTTGNPAGEGRMIFCLINNGCTAAEQMNIIFEYHIPVNDTLCSSLNAWARQWYNLKDLTLGSSQYNAALQAITDQFTLCGTSPSRINQSSLNHLRTNEVALSPLPPQWELREFVLDSVTQQLRQNAVTQVAQDRYNAQVDNPDVERWVSFVNSNAKSILNVTFVVPDSLKGFSFGAAKTTVLGKPTGKNAYHWDGIDSVTSGPAFVKKDGVRFNASLFACSACHAGETQTDFTHVDPVFFGTQATLSGFLSGKAGRGGAIDADGDSTNDKMSVTDAAGRPAGSPSVHGFNEIKRRAQDLKVMAETSCSSLFSLSQQLLFEPVSQVH